jgi:hypothetical protein
MHKFLAATSVTTDATAVARRGDLACHPPFEAGDLRQHKQDL